MPRAYAGATVLLTGGSGFVGGLCLAALLRECAQLRRVYVLLRPDARRGLDARARLQRLLDGPIFRDLWCPSRACFVYLVRSPAIWTALWKRSGACNCAVCSMWSLPRLGSGQDARRGLDARARLLDGPIFSDLWCPSLRFPWTVSKCSEIRRLACTASGMCNPQYLIRVRFRFGLRQ